MFILSLFTEESDSIINVYAKKDFALQDLAVQILNMDIYDVKFRKSDLPRSLRKYLLPNGSLDRAEIFEDAMSMNIDIEKVCSDIIDECHPDPEEVRWVIQEVETDRVVLTSDQIRGRFISDTLEEENTSEDDGPPTKRRLVYDSA